jgi:hypothetical protein
MDSSQAFFCRDLWIIAGLKDPTVDNGGVGKVIPTPVPAVDVVVEEGEEGAEVEKGLKRKRKDQGQVGKRGLDNNEGQNQHQEEANLEVMLKPEPESHRIGGMPVSSCRCLLSVSSNTSLADSFTCLGFHRCFTYL